MFFICFLSIVFHFLHSLLRRSFSVILSKISSDKNLICSKNTLWSLYPMCEIIYAPLYERMEWWLFFFMELHSKICRKKHSRKIFAKTGTFFYSLQFRWKYLFQKSIFQKFKALRIAKMKLNSLFVAKSLENNYFF